MSANYFRDLSIINDSWLEMKFIFFNEVRIGLTTSIEQIIRYDLHSERDIDYNKLTETFQGTNI